MSSIVKNLRRLQGVGILADRNAKSPDINFRKLNLIYGFNGAGKSTLSRLFASLENGELHPKLPGRSSFEVAMSGGEAFGFPDKLTGLERRMLVFNSDFQEKNFQWSQGRANPVFFIGADQADAADELRKLETKIFEETFQSTAASEAVKKAEKILAEFKKKTAKETAERLHLGNRKYEARQLTADYESWAPQETNLLSDDDLKAAEDIRKLAEPMPPIREIEFDAQSVLKAFRFIVEACSQSFGEVALAEAKKFPDMLLWLKQGHAFHRENTLTECLFCGNAISEERWEALAQALDSRVDQFVERLQKANIRLRAISDLHDAIEPSLPGNDALSPDIRVSYNEHREKLRACLRDTRAYLAALSGSVEKKLARPATPLNVLELPSEVEVESRVADLSAAIGDLNKVVSAHNGLVSKFQSHKEAASTAIRRHFVAKCRKQFDTLLAEKSRSEEEAASAEFKLEKSKAEASELRQKIRTHGPAAGVINQLVASYLGHSELTIAPLEEGYEIRRHGTAIEGFPSEGEKTAIAISYFLSTIESDGRTLEDMIVVVDDPVSSLDTKALNYACGLVRSRLEKAAQLFVLTHNQQCMNEFRKAWKNKARPPEGKEPTAALLFMDVTVPQGSNRRVSNMVEMSKLLREYDSEYHFLMSHVFRFSEFKDNYSEYAYMLPNVLRRVLDVFLAFRCPGSSGLVGKIEQLCKEYPDLDRDRLSALERLSQVESHSDNLDDLISLSSMTLEETSAATEALLDMMERVDKGHLDGLRRLCRN